MFNREEFIAEFVAAVKAGDNNRIKELSDAAKDHTPEERLAYMDDIIAGLKKEEEVDEEIVKALTALNEQLRLMVEDSTSEEAKDKSEAKEVTQDVAADTGAEAEATEGSEVEEGEAPAEEEKEEKTEQ